MAPIRAPRNFRDDERGVNEIIGFMLAFVISAIILVTSTQTFTRAQDNTESVVTAVELRGVANRVASRVTQAGVIAQEIPNATVSIRLRLETDFGGVPYEVVAQASEIAVRTADDTMESTATTFELESVPYVNVEGTAISSAGWMTVDYEWQRPLDASGQYSTMLSQQKKLITITEG